MPLYISPACSRKWVCSSMLPPRTGIAAVTMPAMKAAMKMLPPQESARPADSAATATART